MDKANISLAEYFLAGGLLCTIIAAGLCQFVIFGLIGLASFPVGLILLIAAGSATRTDNVLLRRKTLGLILYMAGMILLLGMAFCASSLVYELAMSMCNPKHFEPANIKWISAGGFSIVAAVVMPLGLWLRTGWSTARCIYWGIAVLCVPPAVGVMFWILKRFLPITA